MIWILVCQEDHPKQTVHQRKQKIAECLLEKGNNTKVTNDTVYSVFNPKSLGLVKLLKNALNSETLKNSDMCQTPAIARKKSKHIILIFV